MESLILGYLHPCVHCSINHSSQAMGTAQMSVDRWTDKEKVDYTQSVIQPIKKKQKGNSATCNNMDEPEEHYAEWDEDEYRMSTA